MTTTAKKNPFRKVSMSMEDFVRKYDELKGKSAVPKPRLRPKGVNPFKEPPTETEMNKAKADLREKLSTTPSLERGQDPEGGIDYGPYGPNPRRRYDI